MRGYLIGHEDLRGPPARLELLKQELPSKHTTAAYLIFSDGHATVTIEKDYASGVVRESSSFIALTNHDLEDEQDEPQHKVPTNAAGTRQAAKRATLQDFVEESTDRLKCMNKKWLAKVRREHRKAAGRQRSGDKASLQAVEDSLALQPAEVATWLTDWPTTNETTHYAAIMDAQAGTIAWVRKYPVPIIEPVN